MNIFSIGSEGFKVLSKRRIYRLQCFFLKRELNRGPPSRQASGITTRPQQPPIMSKALQSKNGITWVVSIAPPPLLYRVGSRGRRQEGTYLTTARSNPE